MSSPLFSPITAVWLCWAIVGISPIAGAYAAPLINPALLVLLGSFLGSLYFLPWLIRHKKWGELFSKNTFWPFLFIGTFGTALPFTISLWALHYTTPGNAAILQQSELLYSFFFAHFFLEEKPSAQQLLGSFLILVGILSVLFTSPYTAHWKGDLLILGSTWMFQAASTAAKKLPQTMDPHLIGMARNLFALPVLTLSTGVLFTHSGSLLFEPSGILVLLAIYTGFLKYGLAMTAWYRAIRALDLSKVTAIYLSYPALALLFSALLGFEKPSLQQILGLLCSFTGAYWLSLSIKKEGH